MHDFRSDLAEALEPWKQLRECYLDELRLVNRGYRIEAVFDSIWTYRGHIRRNIDEVQRLVTLTFIGVVRLHLEGGPLLRGDGPTLAPETLAPEEVPWSLSEVSWVVPIEPMEGAAQAVSMPWETGDRQIDIHFQRFTIDPVAPTWDDPDRSLDPPGPTAKDAAKRLP